MSIARAKLKDTFMYYVIYICNTFHIYLLYNITHYNTEMQQNQHPTTMKTSTHHVDREEEEEQHVSVNCEVIFLIHILGRKNYKKANLRL